MAKKVVGVYNTEVEVMEVVSNLEHAGYAPEDITLIAKNSEESSWLWNDTNYDTNTADNNDDESFWEMVKNFFSNDSTDDYSDSDGYVSRFTSYGLTDAEAQQYNAEVELGKIVVLAPDDNETINSTGVTSSFGTNVKSETEEVFDSVNREELDIDMENSRDRSSNSRELDAVFMEDEDIHEKRKRQAQRKWLFSDEENNRL